MRSKARSTSERRARSFSKVSLTERSVYSCWNGCFHSSAIWRTLAKRFRRGKAELMAVHDADASRLELAQPARMAMRSACISSISVRRSRKLKRMKANSGRWLIEQFAGGFFYLAALLDEICLQHVAEAAEAAKSGDHFFQRLAPGNRSSTDLAQDGFHDLRGVFQLDLLVIDLRRSAKREILDQEKVGLVAIHIRFGRLAEMALDQGAESGFAGIQRGHLQQMAKLIDENLLVHGVEPGLNLGEEFRGPVFQADAACRAERESRWSVAWRAQSK